MVLIPMAFTNRSYLGEFETRLKRTAPVLKLCLVAPLDTIRARLGERAKLEGRTGLTAFEEWRSSECVAAHGDAFLDSPSMQQRRLMPFLNMHGQSSQRRVRSWLAEVLAACRQLTAASPPRQ
ncbi:hypothetical protein VW35_09645 [Devosia soli]|uniref:Uncharacterized protein n=1 Tax=Devosia soli TaxID=361041 RepID=A0A0F5L931_9HYPH|nr:hypothetical protein VW35_09645 [Devosia soli]